MYLSCNNIIYKNRQLALSVLIPELDYKLLKRQVCI